MGSKVTSISAYAGKTFMSVGWQESVTDNEMIGKAARDFLKSLSKCSPSGERHFHIETK